MILAEFVKIFKTAQYSKAADELCQLKQAIRNNEQTFLGINVAIQALMFGQPYDIAHS